MQRIEEFEQLKREYCDVQVPEQSLSVVMEAVARAKREKKRRTAQAVKYGALAASLVLVFFFGWSVLFLNGGASAENSAAPNMSFDTTGADCQTSVTMDKGDMFVVEKDGIAESVEDVKFGASSSTNKFTAKYDPQENGSNALPESAPVEAAEKVKEYLTTESARIKAAEEILHQAAERGLEGVENAFEKTADGKWMISGDQSCHLNEDGALILVFDITDEVNGLKAGKIEVFSISKEMLKDMK